MFSRRTIMVYLDKSSSVSPNPNILQNPIYFLCGIVRLANKINQFAFKSVKSDYEKEK